MATPSGRTARRLAAIGCAIGALAFGALPAARWGLRLRESNPILRGRLQAETQGCFNCHRPFGAAELANPDSRWGSVPRFAEGNASMYADSCAEIGEFIRFGAPRSWLKDAAVVARLEGQHLRMPAYGELLADDELADLIAFACAVEGVDPLPAEADAGQALSRRHGCPACHGVGGSGGLPNPRSVGGFIPGFLGGNFTDLVQSRAEFHQWVAEGTSRRLGGNPLVAWFWRRQAISMPAYGRHLSADEIDQIWRWIQARRETVPPRG